MYLTTREKALAALETARLHCRPNGAVIVLPDCVRETFMPQTSHGGEDRPDERALRYLEWTWDPDPSDTTFEVAFAFLCASPTLLSASSATITSKASSRGRSDRTHGCRARDSCHHGDAKLMRRSLTKSETQMTPLPLLRFRRAVLVVSFFSFVAFPAAGRTVKRDTPFQRELSARIEAMLRKRDSRVNVGSQDFARDKSWVMPVDGVSREELIDTFGAPRHGGRRHQGIDIFAPRGTPVLAVTGGIVTAIRRTPNGGRCLYLISADGYMFYYAHLDRWAAGLTEGESVRRGRVLGYVGNSGNAARSRCHLHFEIQEDGRTRNPYVLLQRRTGDEEPFAVGKVAVSTR